MQVVVDANVLIVLALSVPGFDFVADHRLSAPRVGRSEAISAIHEALWRGDLAPEHALKARDRVIAARLDLADDLALHREAWNVAERFGWARTYAASYVALAERKRVPLVTEDERLRRTLVGHLEVLGLADL